MVDYKICLLGASGVGKSCISLQFISEKFTSQCESTIEDLYKKNIRVSDVIKKVEIIDTSGKELMSKNQETYITKSDGIIIVYSITDENSFNLIKNLNDHIQNIKKDSKVALILVGNKLDLAGENRQVNEVHGKEIALKWNCLFQEVSAKTNVNVQECFLDLIKKIENDKLSESNETKKCCLML